MNKRTSISQMLDRRIFATIATMPILMFAVMLPGSPAAAAADIAGAWASDVKICDKIFQRKGANLSFAKGSDTYGSGFIIDGNTIRGRIANCKIKTKKQDGDLLHLIAACATDVMLSNYEFTLKILGDNSVSRVFAGMPEMETPYYRCPH